MMNPKSSSRNAPLQIFKDPKDMGQGRVGLSVDTFIFVLISTALSYTNYK